MNFLLAHNFYQQAGGEDQVFAAEANLLRRNGHNVFQYAEHNAGISKIGAAKAAIDCVWNGKSARDITEMVRRNSPDVVHFHNTFPLISPAAYYAVQREGVPVIQTLHNFRLVCPGATLFRDGRSCEECIDRKSLWPAIEHKCYRESRPATAAAAAMLQLHRSAGTWRSKIDLYIAPSEFVRHKFIQAGLPEKRIVVKPYFPPADPGVGPGGGYALFVGRLSAEKGISVLANAWNQLAGIPLIVTGDGPLAAATHWPPGVQWIGAHPHERVLALMREAQVLIVPSVWYETGPLTILEAFACGLPVIASNLGSMAERVTHERTGLLFNPGDAADLARKVRWAFEHPEAMDEMRAAARREFEQKYTAERNYKMLISIYEQAIEQRAPRSSAQEVLCER